MTVEIYRDCERCNGTGEISTAPLAGGSGTKTCPDCGGTKKMLFATSDGLETLLDDLKDKVDDILDKCNDILEQVT